MSQYVKSTDKIPRPRFWNDTRYAPYLFILPNMILFATFMIIPLIMTFVLSLLKWNGLGSPEFIGLANYSAIFNDKVFFISLWNTLLFTFFTVPILMTFALALSILLNTKVPLRGFFRSAIYMPAVVSMVAAGMVFIWLFNPQIGFINYCLELLGLQKVDWTNTPRNAMIMVVVGTLWTRVGYNMVIYIAGLQGISGEYYEAAQIDGASKLQQFMYITMPLLRSTHIFIFITSIIHSFRSFDLIYTMTKGGPLNATKTLVVYIYDNAFQKNRHGNASAAGVVLFLILLIFTIIRMKGEQKNA